MFRTADNQKDHGCPNQDLQINTTLLRISAITVSHEILKKNNCYRTVKDTSTTCWPKIQTFTYLYKLTKRGPQYKRQKLLQRRHKTRSNETFLYLSKSNLGQTFQKLQMPMMVDEQLDNRNQNILFPLSINSYGGWCQVYTI